ncbi:MAG: transposase [Planctomycetia bacterium]|nr:transposase [Planctomycetia bacterium]
MGQSLVKNLIHLVFSTKNREPWILDDSAPLLWAYQAGIFKEWESPALVIGGIEDHVHAFWDELRALLKRHGSEFDERYIWD